ncbi:FadR family transcriptional regulator [Sphingomonas sp. R647]|uniref:FadR/GntR family transcriptional regulator n=1 Tax=Sphingomonas sp. R647 TaxID=2875233 RepID=UPI001CD1A664|nr:FadR/GntR family transcriptional regulator [Sphingomonas sp. R647]MCA1199441.1 FadR family transcriptional regulator [Sphingomonas sp. R647]
MAERRLFQEVAERIAAMIAGGTYPPGSRLPGERELAEQLGVSRVTIREAEIALQAQGLLAIKTGSGVYVTDGKPAPTDAPPQVSAFELTEARSLFESEAAALAASTVTREMLARLDELLEIMGRDDSDDAASTAADQEFHLLIASASGNQAVIHVIKQLWRMRTEMPEVRTTYASVCQHDGRTRQREHAAIVDALRAGDSGAARIAMRQHFNRLLEAMLDATEEREISELRRKSAESRERFLMTARLR